MVNSRKRGGSEIWLFSGKRGGRLFLVNFLKDVVVKYGYSRKRGGRKIWLSLEKEVVVIYGYFQEKEVVVFFG